MEKNNDKNKTSTKAADLLKRIQETQRDAEETLKTARESASQVSYVAGVIKKISSGFSWVNDKVVEPTLGLIPFTKPMWQATLRQYSWFCHPSEPFPNALWRGTKNIAGRSANGAANIFREEKENFEKSALPLGNFSKSRAGIAVLVTAFAASPIAEKIPLAGQFIPDIISDHASALLYEPPYDATRMALTALFNGGELNKEIIYLNGKNEIDPKNDVWSVGGCETKQGCGSEDAISFRIKPSLMHQAWSWSTGRGPFLPDYVAVPIPNVPSKCEVTSYGTRWRISKWMNSYPVLLDAHCNANTQEAPQQKLAP